MPCNDRRYMQFRFYVLYLYIWSPHTCIEGYFRLLARGKRTRQEDMIDEVGVNRSGDTRLGRYFNGDHKIKELKINRSLHGNYHSIRSSEQYSKDIHHINVGTVL